MRNPFLPVKRTRLGRRGAIVWLAVLLLGWSGMAKAADSGELHHVRGAASGIEIRIDRWGIPHIKAATVEDAFFGQGYAAALLRLWQLDVNHRRGLGTLAEAFGSAFLEHDRLARLTLYRGEIEAEWARLDPRVRPVARAFAAGINARLDELAADPSLLPVEFRTMGMRPSRWTADDLLHSRLTAAPNVRAEARRAALACHGALDLDALAQPLEPAWTPRLPSGLDPCKVRPEDLTFLELRSAPLPFAHATRHAGLPSEPDIDSRNGSNAWVIAPRLTATGRPILANDPHLRFELPSPRMITHLSAPGFNVIGAGPVWRPGVQFGHNAHIAFGRTDFQIDQEDLYQLDLAPDGQSFRGPAGDEPIERVRETIAVRDGAPVQVELAFTARGPVVFEDRAAHRGLALRAAWLQPGAAVHLEYVPKVFATDWQEFRAAIRHAVWGTNYVYADVSGNIGWQAAGRVPVRRNHDGLLPVPAAGDYPWDGFMPLEQMPGEYNPARGWIGTANQIPFPPDWPVAERVISFEWIADDRYRRLSALLSGVHDHRPEDSWRMQQDVHSVRADALLALLRSARGPAAEDERAMLSAWDGGMRADSREAALFAFWWTELQKALRPLLVPREVSALIPAVHPQSVIAALANPDTRFGADPANARDAVLLNALTRAAVALRKRAATGEQFPTWGSLHRVNLDHALAERLGADVVKRVEGHQSGGDGATLMARWWVSAEHPEVTGGASFRAVVDVGNWEATRAMIGPGQAGSPGDAHFADLYDSWLDNGDLPLSFTDDAVRGVTERTLRLVPAGEP